MLHFEHLYSKVMLGFAGLADGKPITYMFVVSSLKFFLKSSSAFLPFKNIALMFGYSLRI